MSWDQNSSNGSEKENIFESGRNYNPSPPYFTPYPPHFPTGPYFQPYQPGFFGYAQPYGYHMPAPNYAFPYCPPPNTAEELPKLEAYESTNPSHSESIFMKSPRSNNMSGTRFSSTIAQAVNKSQQQEQSFSSAYNEENDPPSPEHNPSQTEAENVAPQLNETACPFDRKTNKEVEMLDEIKEEPESFGLYSDYHDEVFIIGDNLPSTNKTGDGGGDKERPGMPELKLTEKVLAYYRARRKLFDELRIPLSCGAEGCNYSPTGAKRGHFRWKKTAKQALFLIDAHCTRPLYNCSLCPKKIQGKRTRFNFNALKAHFSFHHPGREVKLNVVGSVKGYEEEVIKLIELCLPVPSDRKAEFQKRLREELDEEEEEEKVETTIKQPVSVVKPKSKKLDADEDEEIKALEESKEGDKSDAKPKVTLKPPAALVELMNQRIDQYRNANFKSMKCRGSKVSMEKKKSGKECPNMYDIVTEEGFSRKSITNHVLFHYDQPTFRCLKCRREVRWLRQHFEVWHRKEVQPSELLPFRKRQVKALKTLAQQLFPQPQSLLAKKT